jgi:hypothetical protein
MLPRQQVSVMVPLLTTPSGAPAAAVQPARAGVRAFIELDVREAGEPH